MKSRIEINIAYDVSDIDLEQIERIYVRDYKEYGFELDLVNTKVTKTIDMPKELNYGDVVKVEKNWTERNVVIYKYYEIFSETTVYFLSDIK